jgi:hypothetical protein
MAKFAKNQKALGPDQFASEHVWFGVVTVEVTVGESAIVSDKDAVELAWATAVARIREEKVSARLKISVTTIILPYQFVGKSACGWWLENVCYKYLGVKIKVLVGGGLLLLRHHHKIIF